VNTIPKTLFVDATWEEDIELGDDVIIYLRRKHAKNVAVFASVQFLKLEGVFKQLESIGINVLTTKAKRTHVTMQILGCDAYHDAFDTTIIQEADAILYVGDGLFHPKAILLSQREGDNIKEVCIWDPVSKKMRIIDYDTIKKQLIKTRSNLKRFISAQVVGILVTIKPGQEYMDQALALKEHLEKQGKEVYIFVDDHLKIDQMENYPFIDAWVNTACPRIGLDDHVHAPKPLINSREARDPVKALEQLYIRE
jgi:2-(3-amino-3-carboxypropyl)histidine synthase